MRGFQITLTVEIPEDDVVTNDLDAMSSITSHVADVVDRFYPHLIVSSSSGEIL